MEDFWQQYPKSLRTNADGIEIGLCPSIGEEDYRVGGEEEYKLYFYLKDGVYRFREGISKTHTIYVGEGLEKGASLLVAQASEEWNCKPVGLSGRSRQARMVDSPTMRRESSTCLANTRIVTTRTVNTGC